MKVRDSRVVFSESEGQALVEFMSQMDREHSNVSAFPVSAQDRLYWRLGGPERNGKLGLADDEA